MEPGLILSGLFRHLIARGFPLSVRDYRDALRALQLRHGMHTRAELLQLCQALWARSDEEIRWLEQLFNAFPQPSEEELAPYRRADESRRDAQSPATGAGTEPRPESPRETPQITFTPPDSSGSALPRARIPRQTGEYFILEPRPPLPERALIVAWRRYRRALRAGPRTEINIQATIAEKCRTGLVDRPVLAPARRNQARLLVLVDASPSMTPWRPLQGVLESSLEESRLAWSRILYFDNTPNEWFEHPGLHFPVDPAVFLRDSGPLPLLILSDAGVFGRRGNRARINATRDFLQSTAVSAGTVAWLNPAPRRRWPGSTAQRIAELPGLAMFEANDDGLIAAIDVLRGARHA